MTKRSITLPVFNTGWYRYTFDDVVVERGKMVRIEFDGAMSDARVYLNGEFVGGWPYGYASFQFDLTPHWNYEGENILAVRLENLEESSRWYPGAGLYRNVRLVVHNPIHVAHWGTYITTPEVSSKSAAVNIKTTLEGVESVSGTLQLKTTIYNSENTVVASRTTKVDEKVSESVEVEQTLQIKRPELWSPESPSLYRAISQVYDGATLVDEYSTTMGVRSIRYDKDKGFFLNDQPYKMKGVCMHHDLGPLGAAVNYRALERQMEIMKQMGCNAIRTSHNPPAPELLEICDRMGLLVQCEAFDEWKIGKNVNGYNRLFDEWAERDLSAMIRRDRNHPSVVMWSIGNEIREQRDKEGYKVARYLVDICHRVDPTRPTTAGFNNHDFAITNGLAAEVDLVGFNYKPHDYLKKHQENPDYIIYGSETNSTVSSRGDYKFPVVQNKRAYHDDYKVSSYDTDVVSWGTIPDTEFAAQDDCEFIFGEFVWTGFDYLGEPSPYNKATPARSSYFGIVDLVGFKKDRYFLYQSKWSDEPMLHLLPHWNWEGRVGDNVPVMCYTNYPSAELFVNGVSQGVRSKRSDGGMFDRYRLAWMDVVYEAGQIEVVAYDDEGREADRKVIKTAGEPYAIVMTPDRSTLSSDGKDLSYVTIEVVDKDGNLCPTTNQMIFLDVQGAGSLEALCNGDQTDQSSFASSYMRLYNGKLMAVIRSEKESGVISVAASGSLLKGQTIEITAE